MEVVSLSPETDRVPAPQLLAIVHGLGSSGLTALRAAAPWLASTPTTALPDGAAGWQQFVAGSLDAASELHDLGVAIDRSSHVLRRAHASDEAMVAAIQARPTGPAAGTVLELDALVETCSAAGSAAQPAAIARLATLLRVAAERLGNGSPAEVWLLGLGDLQQVHSTFDFIRAFGRRVPSPLRRELVLSLSPGAAVIRAANDTARDRVLEVLRRAPFCHRGDVTTSTPNELQFLAAPGIAFGARHRSVRPANPDESAAIAAPPLAPREPALPADLAGLFARFWLAAAAHATDPAPAPIRRRQPDVESMPSLVEATPTTATAAARTDSALPRSR